MIQKKQINNLHIPSRADIDGLRGLAVLMVIIYHTFPNWVKAGNYGQGGFIGVDIFFTISGFLITSIILKNITNKSFSFISFCKGRIKRIFPALLIVLVGCLIFGWFTLFSDEYMALGKHVAASSLFSNNFLLWTESGYFDSQSEIKPLLHLWSLGIEEQFYIVWPFFIWFLYKLNKNLLWSFLVVFLISFSFHLNSLYLKNTSLAFYMPHLRLWELVSGACLAYFLIAADRSVSYFNVPKVKLLNEYFNKNNLINISAIAGLFLIIAGAVVISKHNFFPGWWALLFPVTGTLLIINATNEAWLNKHLLSNKLLVWVGIISYPLYLWHWPLLSFAHILENDTPSRPLRMLAILLAFIFAWATYYFVEKPIRNDKKNFTLILLLVMSFLGLTGYAIYKNKGIKTRSAEKFLLTNKFYTKTTDAPYRESCAKLTQENYPDDWCNIGSSQNKKPEILLIGDSHAAAYSTMFKSFSLNRPLKPYIEFGRGQCPSLLNYGPAYCKKITADVFKYIRDNKQISIIVLAANWPAYINGKDYDWINYNETSKNFKQSFITTLQKLQGMNKKIIVFLTVPMNQNPKNCVTRPISLSKQKLNQCNVTLDFAIQKDAGSRDFLIKTLQNMDIKFFDPYTYMCESNICKVIDKEKVLKNDIEGHLSIYGGEFLANKAQQELNILFK